MGAADPEYECGAVVGKLLAEDRAILAKLAVLLEHWDTVQQWPAPSTGAANWGPRDSHQVPGPFSLAGRLTLGASSFVAESPGDRKA